jgi:hypothetical protein
MENSRVFASTAAAIDYIQSFRWEGANAQQLQRECRKQDSSEKQAAVGNDNGGPWSVAASQHKFHSQHASNQTPLFLGGGRHFQGRD